MKAGLVVGAAIATAVAVMVSCAPDRIPGSPISSAEPGVSFNAASGSGNALASSSGSLSGSLSGSISGSSGISGSGPQGGCKSVSGSVSGSTSGSTVQPPANCGGGNESNSDSGLHCGNDRSVTVSGSTSSAIGSSSDSRYCKDKGKGNDDR